MVVASVLGVLVGVHWRPLLSLDQRIEESVHRVVLAHRWLFDLAHVVTYTGDPVVVTALSLLLALVLARRGRVRDAGYVLAVRLVAALLSSGLKVVVDRPRPVLDHPLLHVATTSFPSGHALGAAALWGSVAVLAGGRLRRAGRLALAAVVPVVVAASRVVLGVHFVTDVVAGLVLGWATALVLDGLVNREPRAFP